MTFAGDEFAARKAVVDAGLRLQAEGLVARTWGNVSVRLDDRRMAITPSGIPYEDLTPESIVVVDLISGKWSGALKPSGERKLHAAVYAARSDIGAVIHTHQAAASVFAAARKDLSQEIRCAAYALPGTKKLTAATVAALGDAPSALMANHGALCVGGDLDVAFAVAKKLESNCAATIAALPSAAKLPLPIDAPWDPSWVAPSSENGAELRSTAPYTVAYSRGRCRLAAILDDLAQLIGTSVGWKKVGAKGHPCVFIRGEGAELRYSSRYDAEAAAMVLEKACRAALAGELIGGAARLPYWEAALMRVVYLKKYSRLRDTSQPPSR